MCGGGFLSDSTPWSYRMSVFPLGTLAGEEMMWGCTGGNQTCRAGRIVSGDSYLSKVTVCKYLNLGADTQGDAEEGREIGGVSSRCSFHHGSANEELPHDRPRSQPQCVTVGPVSHTHTHSDTLQSMYTLTHTHIHASFPILWGTLIHSA